MSDVALYILMRTDMASMNPGKAVAQGSHAANQMVYEIRNRGTNKAKALLEKWELQANGFGTCYVLGVNQDQLYVIIRNYPGAKNSNIVMANIVNDPTYPVRDGEVTHLISVDTCGYIFGIKEDIEDAISDFNLELMP